MPDRWGRTTASDFNNITQGLRNIQGSIQRNKTFEQQQALLADQEKFKSDANYNAGLYEPGAVQLDEGSPYGSEDEARESAMRGTPAARAKGKQIAAAGMGADKAIKEYAQDKEYQEKYSKLLSWRQQNQDTSWDMAPLDLYGGVQGMRAYADIIDDASKTEVGKNTIMKNRLARIGVAYKQFDITRNYINEAMQQGEIDKAVNGIEKLSQELPLPYQVGEYDPKSNTFQVQYLDSQTGKFQNSGTMTMDEMVKKINATGEKEFVGQMAMSFEATRQSNLEKRQNPMHAKSNTGARFLVIPQKNVLDPSKVNIEVRNEKTNEPIIFHSWEALQDAGITLENLDREKAMKDMEYKDQQIDTSKAAMRSHDRSNVPTEKDRIDASIKQTKKYKDDLSFVLTPFVKPGSDMAAMFSDDGGLTSEGKGALQAAMSFVQDNPDPSKLNEMDQMKYMKGKQAVQLYNGMSQTIIDGYSQKGGKDKGKKPGPNDPPVKGAKKAKDGFWYVQKDGKWNRVVTGANGIPDDLKSSHGWDKTAMGGSKYGQRADGTEKGSGFLGEIQNPDGTVSTELSIGVNLDGQDVEIPILVPTLTAEEIKIVQSIRDPKQIPDVIVKKAVDHARERISRGLSPFAQEGEREISPGLREMQNSQSMPTGIYNPPFEEPSAFALKKRPQ